MSQVRRHVLVVRFEHDTGRVQVCCICRPRSANDRIGEPLTPWCNLGPDEVVGVFDDHRHNRLPVEQLGPGPGSDDPIHGKPLTGLQGLNR